MSVASDTFAPGATGSSIDSMKRMPTELKQWNADSELCDFSNDSSRIFVCFVFIKNVNISRK